MKFVLFTALALTLPLMARADGQAHYRVEVTAVACVFSASNELEDCRLVTNPVNELISVKLERTKVEDWVYESKELNKVYALRAPQLSHPVEFGISVHVGRDAGSQPPSREPYSLGADIGFAPRPVIHPFASIGFADIQGFKRFHAEGERRRFSLGNGKTVELSPQINVTDLTITD